MPPARPDPRSLVRADKVCHWYGEHALRRQILFDVSFELKPGEVVNVYP